MNTSLLKKIFLCLFVLSFLVFYLIFIRSNYDDPTIRSYISNFASLKKKNVFIDLGAHTGDSVRYFVDKDKDTNNNGIKGYAARDESIKWEIHVVEANPLFNQNLDDLKVYCERLGHKIYIYKQTAAWVRNEKLTFYLNRISDGSSLMKDNENIIKSNFKNVSVDGIDVSELLSLYNDKDEVILKVDIEGTEYELLEHLIKKDTLRLVDIIAMEYHNRLFNDKTYSETEMFLMKYFKLFDIKFIKWQ